MNVRSGLTTSPLDVTGMLSAVAAPDCGAMAVFVGTVRNHHEGREVVAIDYSAYEAMAAKTLEQIAAELAEATPGLRLLLRHRLGRIAVGEASIAIVAASARREAALTAIRTALERVKSEAPIWKLEIYADGSERWREEEPLASPASDGAG